MALNQFMHPRNRYRDVRPDFNMLAEKYEEFRKHTTTDSKGKVHVEFKSLASLRALTWSLLKNDFDIDISIPLDRLIPTVPLRLNYILWLEDIFRSADKPQLLGIDIGTGASCVYALLGAKLNGWKFIATDADATNIDYATDNVSRNNLSDRIRVVHVNEDTTLQDVVRGTDDDYDFCMCNPPFYGSNLEAWGWLTTRKDADRPRAEPTSVSTASPIEGIAPGGEVQFVRERIIDSSVELQTRVRVYTTMLGKKSSVATLKEALRMKGITNIGTTEFCQGKTMRWGLAWTYDPSIKFPKPVSKLLKAEKAKPPLTYMLPNKYSRVTDVALMMESIFTELPVSHSRTSSEDDVHGWRIECRTNTWSHQRRRRRQMMRASQHQQQSTHLATDPVKNITKSNSDVMSPSLHDSGKDDAPTPKISLPNLEDSGLESSTLSHSAESDTPVPDSSDNGTPIRKGTTPDPASVNAENLKSRNSDSAVPVQSVTSEHDPCSSEGDSPAAKRPRLELVPSVAEGQDGSPQCKDRTLNPIMCGTDTEMMSTGNVAAGDLAVMMSCDVSVRKVDLGVKLEMSWVDGQNREVMHQFLQFFKNRFV